MADGVASRSRLRRETEVRSQLPYARHVNDHVVALDSGALMMVFQVAAGMQHESDEQLVDPEPPARGGRS